MYTVLIAFQSLTHAQRACRLLEKKGCLCSLTRPPAGLLGSSCAYGVRLRRECLHTAKEALQEAGMKNSGFYQLTEGHFVPMEA